MPTNNDDICNKLSVIQDQLTVLTDLLRDLVKKPKRESSSAKKVSQGIAMIPYPVQSITPEKSQPKPRPEPRVTKATKPSPKCRSKEVPKILNDLLTSQSTAPSLKLDKAPIGAAALQNSNNTATRAVPRPLSAIPSFAPPAQPAAPAGSVKRLRLEGLSTRKGYGPKHLKWS